MDIDRDTAHDAAQRELSKPIYPRPSLLQRLSDWFDEQLFRLVLKGSTVPGGWFTVLILLIVLTVAVVVAIRVARRTMRTNRGGDHRLFGATELTAAEYRAAAAACADRGDWALAIRHRLRAVARDLEESGTLTPVPGRTAGELARDAGAKIPGLAAEFATAAAVFNDVTYGEVAGTAAGYGVVADLDDRLRIRTAPAAGHSARPSASDGWTPIR